METTVTPGRSEWKRSHMLRPSYRNPATIDPSHLPLPGHPFTSTSPAVPELPTSQPSISSPRPSGSNASGSQAPKPPQAKKNVISPQTQKKKNLFGGLFVKEPTSAALDKLAAQLMAQHGDLSARTVPGVSSATLPAHVPRVNTKWDGVPEAVKQREKFEKDKARAVKRSSLAATVRSKSAEGSREEIEKRPDSVPSRERRNSNSTLSSFHSRGRAGYQHQLHRGSSEQYHTSWKASSLESDESRTAAKAQSLRSQSLRTPSGSSLPEITSFFPNGIPAQKPDHARYPSEDCRYLVNLQRNSSCDGTRFDPSAILFEPQIDFLTEHISSPVATSADGSHLTSQSSSPSSTYTAILPVSPKADKPVFVSTGADAPDPQVATTIPPKGEVVHVGFLAGEARPFELPPDESVQEVRHLTQPDLPLRRSKSKSGRDLKNPIVPVLPSVTRVQQNLEKRPDSSRARLGLRASMILRTDLTSWDWEDDSRSPEPRGISPQPSFPNNPKDLVPQ